MAGIESKAMSKSNASGFANLFPLRDFRQQAMVLVIIGFIFYANSFFNEYALDDDIVINRNEYVLKGFKGIPKILSTDAYDSFYKQMGAEGQLSGGRYRPLSIVTFAIEQQIFGSNAFIRHFLNVLFYLVSIVLLLYFLRNFILKNNSDIAFFTVLLFAIHPIHTEVIANVKSRDEILSFLFIILTGIYAFRYHEEKKPVILFKGLLCFFLALLSKEYGITLLVLIPAMLYLFKNYTIRKSLLGVLPFLIIAVIYLSIRFSIVGIKYIENPDVLNNPFIFATIGEEWATKIFILDNYLRLLIFPHPLSSDYSYNQIPYKSFSDFSVWVSLFVHVAMIVATFVLLKKKHVLAFAILFYLLHLALVSNFLMDIGATMGERLIYHSSFGFSLGMAFLLIKLFEKLKLPLQRKRSALYGLMGITIIFCGFKTIERNKVWKNDITLFITDVKTVPNSVLANGNAGARYIDLSEEPRNKGREQELLDKAIRHLNKAVRIHPKYVNGYLNLGLAYFKLKDLEKAEIYLNEAKRIFPSHPMLKILYAAVAKEYLNRGLILGENNNISDALEAIRKASAIDPQNAEIWYNLGGAYFTRQEFEKAQEAWNNVLLINPDHQDAKRGLEALKNR